MKKYVFGFRVICQTFKLIFGLKGALLWAFIVIFLVKNIFRHFQPDTSNRVGLRFFVQRISALEVCLLVEYCSVPLVCIVCLL